MVGYSIKDLENLSGLKAHTLRIWEKRYGIIKPQRTETNIRYYGDEDLQKILNISLLNRKGIKISKIAGMTNEELKQKVAEITEVGSEFQDQVDSMMMAIFELNESKFNIILDHHIQSEGFETTMHHIVYPLLDKLSTMWIAGSVKRVHETFVINIIKRKIIVAIDKIKKPDSHNVPRFLIYLPENESHELSLLFLHFILSKYGAEVLNMGSNVSLIDILEAKNIYHPDYIFTIFNDSFAESPLQPYIQQLAQNSTETRILISGFQTVNQNLSLPPNVQIIPGIENIKSLLHSLKNGN
jgi:DNA-binding transcriptional MerR regulator